MEKIIVTIDPSGVETSVSIEAEGFTGRDCERATEGMRRKLNVEQHTLKPEAMRRNVRQRQSQRERQ